MWSSSFLGKSRGISAKSLGLIVLGASVLAFAQSTPLTPAAPAGVPAASQRLKVSEATTSQLLDQRVSPKYPDASVRAGTQGAVVLKVDLDTSGAVQDVTVVSGDSTLAQAATDAVRQWKYKPYLVEGSPVEIETQVTVNFRLASPTPPTPLDLGTFQNDSYSNEEFSLFYPLSHDWVRETEIMRKRYPADNPSRGIYVLLTEVHIPQGNAETRADSSFTLVAIRRSSGSATENCQLYLAALGSGVQTNKQGKQKGGVSQFTLGGRNFLRADFEYNSGASDHSTICTAEGEYLLVWNIEGWSKKAVEGAVSTLNSLAPAPPPAKPQPPRPPGVASVLTEGADLARVRVAAGVSTGLLIRKVQPPYPADAKYAGIQGSVVMQAEISKNGDVVDLEVLDGPLELAVSAVNAVRLWKYRPYTLNGEPVAVVTKIIVNYTLARY